MPVTSRTRELIQKYLEGIASGEELAELEQQLAAEPEVADAFVEAVQLDSALGDYFRQQFKMDQVAAILRQPDSNQPADVLVGSEDAALLPAESSQLSGSVFVPRDSRPLAARRAEYGLRPFGAQKRSRWLWLVALLLLIGLSTVTWKWFRAPEVREWQLVSGRLHASGREFTQFELNFHFEVIGTEPAVFQGPKGARIELEPASRAMLTEDSGRTVLKLTSGGADAVVTADANPLRMESVLGTVASDHGRFSVRLIASAPPASFSPTKPERYPRLDVQVAEGLVTVAQGSELVSLSAGEHRVFYSPS